MKPYEPKFKYITRFQYNLDVTNKRDMTNRVVVSPKVARDIENMLSRIRELEKEVLHLSSESKIYNMGLVK